MGYFFTPTAWSDFFQRFSAWFLLEPPLKDKYGFVHISTGLLAKVMVIFGSCLVLHAVVVRIVFTNLRTMSEPRKTSGFVDLVNQEPKPASRAIKLIPDLSILSCCSKCPKFSVFPTACHSGEVTFCARTSRRELSWGRRCAAPRWWTLSFHFFSSCFFLDPTPC